MILASMESFCRILSRRPLIQDGGDRKFSNFRLIRVRHHLGISFIIEDNAMIFAPLDSLRAPD
jgi:hypothetical protein